MTLLDCAPAAPATTAAARAAEANWRSNLAALAETQPRLAATLSPEADLTWTYGRDGSLTAMQVDGSWFLSCSVPRAASREMLKSFEAKGAVACFLDPRHAAAVRVALDKLLPEQAVIAVAPDEEIFRVMLYCEDFSADVRSHRLFFAAGADWPAELAQLLQEHPGLPTPAVFIKTTLLGRESAEQMIAAAQQVLSVETGRRSGLIERLRTTAAARLSRPAGEIPKRACVVSPSRFRLWDNAGAVLAETVALTGIELAGFDPDVPTSASPLALAETLSTCDAIFTANTGRTDLPPVAPTASPWITWVTNGRIPAAPSDAPQDRLVLADVSWHAVALSAGWARDQISVATWPPCAASLNAEPKITNRPHLALLCDTLPLTPPGDEMDLSSHVLLWEAITEELHHNPLAAAGDANAYLGSRMKRLEVSDGGFDRSAFLGRLIFPAFQQGLARMLAAAGLPVRLYGQGWSDIPDLKAHAAGPITSAAAFHGAVVSAAAVIHAWPVPFAHPIDAVSKPVLRPSAARDAFIRSANAALRNPSTKAARPETQALCGPLLLSLFKTSGSCLKP